MFCISSIIKVIVSSLLLSRLHLRYGGWGFDFVLGSEVGETLPRCAVLKPSELLSHLQGLNHHSLYLFIVTKLQNQINNTIKDQVEVKSKSSFPLSVLDYLTRQIFSNRFI